MRSALFRSRAVMLLIGTLVIALLFFGDEVVALVDDRPPLGDELRRTTALVDATAAAVADGRVIMPSPLNPDPTLADQLPGNNHLLSDHSLGFPTYNDCDSWRNLIFDGWQTGYRSTIQLRDGEDGTALLAAGRHFWVSQGFEVNPVFWVSDDTTRRSGIEMRTGHTAYELVIDPMKREASLSAVTDCLPPDV